MINRLNFLASFMNVTAAENELKKHLFDFFLKKGFVVETDRNGCVIVRIKGTSDRKKKIMICTPMDIPGYICLYREKTTSYLTKTCKNSKIEVEDRSLFNEKGQSFSVKESRFDKNEICIDNPNGGIGDVFRPLPHFESDEEYIYGKNVCRYILMDLLMNIADKKPKNDILLCFTTGFYSLGVSEANIAFREKPDTVFMLGFSEDDASLPLFFVKNGKNFAPDHLFQETKGISENLKIDIKAKVSETEATKESSVISAFFTEVFSLGLPYKTDEKKGEKVPFCAIQDLKRILEAFFITK